MHWCPFCGQHHEILCDGGYYWFKCPKMDDVYVLPPPPKGFWDTDEPAEPIKDTQLAHEIEPAIEWPTFIDLTE